jgi:hypothetical protein
MQILPLRVSCLCANSLLEHVTMITTATCKAICMQEGPLVGWGFPGFPLPHKLWGTDGALRPLPASPPHSPALAGPGIPVVADHSARWTGYIGGDTAGFSLLLLFGFFVQRYRLLINNGGTFTASRASRCSQVHSIISHDRIKDSFFTQSCPRGRTTRNGQSSSPRRRRYSIWTSTLSRT